MSKQMLYVPCRLTLWERVAGTFQPFGLEAPIAAGVAGIGFLPVYSSLEEMRADYGEDVDYMAISLKNEARQ